MVEFLPPTVWVDKDDISVLLEHEVAVAHCPLSNMKLGSGIAHRFYTRTRNSCSLITDGPASNDTLIYGKKSNLVPF